jgi:ABC-type transport system involved in cytochrome c biogenesis permease subunit
MDSRVYLFLTLISYAVGAVHVLVHLLTRKRLLTTLTLATTLLGFAFHTAALSQRWTEAGHFPAVGVRDGASFMAWATVLVFLLVYLITRLDALGLFAYPFAFVLVAVASFTPAAGRPDSVLRGLYLPVHTALAFVGYGALFVAFTMGVLYLMQERELRSRSPHRAYYMIPSLERCDTIGGRAVIGGFCFLTLAIVTGFHWSHHLNGRYWTGDPKEWAALIAWVIYVVLIAARFRAGWGGRRAAWLGIAGFVVVVFTFAWATLVPGVAAAAP